MHVQLSKYGDGFTGMAEESPVMSLTVSTHPEGKFCQAHQCKWN